MFKKNSVFFLFKAAQDSTSRPRGRIKPQGQCCHWQTPFSDWSFNYEPLTVKTLFSIQTNTPIPPCVSVPPARGRRRNKCNKCLSHCWSKTHRQTQWFFQPCLCKRVSLPCPLCALFSMSAQTGSVWPLCLGAPQSTNPGRCALQMCSETEAGIHSGRRGLSRHTRKDE